MNRLYTTLKRLLATARANKNRRRRGCRRRALGCLGFLALLLAMAALLLFGLLRRAAAGAPPSESLAVQLVIDNSNSMFDKGGVGTDPEQLRMAAARLFIEYLGIDDNRFHPSCGLIFFGSEAHQVAPLTPLADSAGRQALVELLREPPRLGWTDQDGALQLAQRGLAGASGHRAIILLTDGKPEWSDQPTPAEQAATLEQMARRGRQLGDAGITLFIVLLAGPQTDADPQLAVWQPMWQQMAAATPDGRFLVVRDAADLPTAYHDIVIALTGRQSQGAVVDATIAPGGLRQTVVVEPGLTRLVLVVRKSRPDTVVTIRSPHGGAVPPASGGQLEQMWTIDAPAAGDWLVTADGAGRLTVWKDFERATATPRPTPTLTPAAQEAIPTPRPTATPRPTPTASPAPVFAGTAGATTGGQAGHGRLWPWLGALVLPAVGTVGLLLRRRGPRPVVDGALYILPGGIASDAGPTTPRAASFDLYSLGRTTVTVGAAGDIQLPDVSDRATLMARGRGAGGPELIVAANPAVLCNGRRLLSDQPLFDGDVLALGPARLRYENLQRRRPRRVAPTTHRLTKTDNSRR